jgi:hypothetical protein
MERYDFIDLESDAILCGNGMLTHTKTFLQLKTSVILKEEQIFFHGPKVMGTMPDFTIQMYR